MRLARAPKHLAAALIGCAASACAVGPNYIRPTAPTPAAYKELKGWTASRPADGLPRGDWWRVFRDPILDRLEARVAIDNQNVIAAADAYRQAQDLVAESRAQLFPVLALDSSLTRSASPNALTTALSAEGQASWAPDLWGKVRRTIESAAAGAQASDADLANATLSAQGALASDYMQLRAADSLQALLNATVAQYERSLQIAKNQYAAGTTAQSDVITARTQVLSARAQAIAVGVGRAQLEHAIAVLTGRPPADLSLSKGRLPARIPATPVGVPSLLLERRPDIAGAERRVKQENALIGVAIAGYFPNLTLTGSGGYLGDPFSAIANASSLVWSLGASGAATLFNGFLTQAQVAAARAAYEQSVATYRQTVLSAFQQVEDDLSTLDILARQQVVEDAAVREAQQAVAIALNEYRAGTQSYTTVVTAQAIALQDEESALNIREQRLVAVVALIEALGGGWRASDLQDAARAPATQ